MRSVNNEKKNNFNFSYFISGFHSITQHMRDIKRVLIHVMAFILYHIITVVLQQATMQIFINIIAQHVVDIY